MFSKGMDAIVAPHRFDAAIDVRKARCAHAPNTLRLGAAAPADLAAPLS